MPRVVSTHRPQGARVRDDTTASPPPAAPAAGSTTGDPEDPEFWETTGAPVARRNLVWSIFAEHLGFSVWLFWSVSAALLAKMGFDFTVSQLFLLVAVPNLVGSLLRLPYTFAVPRFGGRNWTVVSALLLLVPTLLFAFAVQDPGTPYWVFVLISATAGVGGGNFASSMANINFFYPARRKGLALGLNAAGGNIGVAVLQLGLPDRGRRRRALRPGRGELRRDPPGAGRLPVRRARRRRRDHGLLLHGQPLLGALDGPGHRRGASSTSTPG